MGSPHVPGMSVARCTTLFALFRVGPLQVPLGVLTLGPSGSSLGVSAGVCYEGVALVHFLSACHVFPLAPRRSPHEVLTLGPEKRPVFGA